MLNFKKLTTGTVLAIALNAAIFSVASFCVLKIGLPSEAAAGMIGFLIAIVSLCAASVITSLWVGERGLFHGVFLALLFSVGYLAVGLLVYREIEMQTAMIRIPAFIVSCALGGIMGVNKTQHIRF